MPAHTRESRVQDRFAEKQRNEMYHHITSHSTTCPHHRILEHIIAQITSPHPLGWSRAKARRHFTRYNRTIYIPVFVCGYVHRPNLSRASGISESLSMSQGGRLEKEKEGEEGEKGRTQGKRFKPVARATSWESRCRSARSRSRRGSCGARLCRRRPSRRRPCPRGRQCGRR